MTDETKVMDTYLTGLRNQHAVETQAIGTVKNELGRMEAYPELHARMQQERERSTEQAARLDRLLAKHGSRASVVKEMGAGGIATAAGVAHAVVPDDMLKNVLSAIGYKAYEIGSYSMLITMAQAAGAADDVPVLEQSAQEEQEMSEWFSANLPNLVHAYFQQSAG